MVEPTFKNPDPILSPVLKVVKNQYDNPALLRQYETVIRRLLFLERGRVDITWHGEALHRLALLREGEGDIDEAESLLIESMSEIAEHEYLTLALAMRDYGLLIATHRDPKAGLFFTEQALALHDHDIKNRKGLRQRRITESYIWRVRLLVDDTDTQARESLIKYALSGCRGCCTRDQHEAIDAALPYADGLRKQLLDARLIEIYARRRKPVSAATSAAKLVINAELSLVKRVIRTVK